jgi:hypothetical protein
MAIGKTSYTVFNIVKLVTSARIFDNWYVERHSTEMPIKRAEFLFLIVDNRAIPLTNMKQMLRIQSR